MTVSRLRTYSVMTKKKNESNIKKGGIDGRRIRTEIKRKSMGGRKSSPTKKAAVRETRVKRAESSLVFEGCL